MQKNPINLKIEESKWSSVLGFLLKHMQKQKVKTSIFISFSTFYTSDKHSNSNVRFKVPKGHSHPIALLTQPLPGPWLLHICTVSL